MPNRVVDLSGRQFGALRVIATEAVIRPNGPGSTAAHWLCRCECGQSRLIRATKLLRGLAQHCGCLGYRRDPIRHAAARAKVAPAKRRAIARLGAKARQSVS